MRCVPGGPGTQFKLRITNLPPKCNESELKMTFRKFDALSVEVENGPRAMGYVTFESQEDMDRALAKPPVRLALPR